MANETTPPTVQPEPDQPFQPGGILNAPATPVTSFRAATYTPQAFETKPEQTVQGQLARIVDQDSELLRQAARRAREQMNARGLLNSSAAIGAAQEATIAQALPIAQQDAATYQRNLEQTINARHAQLAQQAQAENAAMAQAAQAAEQRKLAELDAGTRQRIAQLQADTTLTTTEKELRTRELIAEAERANRLQLQQMTEAGALARLELDAGTRERIARLQADTTLTTTEKELRSRELIAEAERANRVVLQSMEDAAALTRVQLDADTRRAIAQIDADTKLTLGQLDANNRQLLQVNASAAEMYQQAVRNIAAIATSDLGPLAKDAATRSQLEMLSEGLRQVAEVARTDQMTLDQLNLDGYFDPMARLKRMTPAQRQAELQGIKNELDEARRVLDNLWNTDYARFQAPPGSMQSERTAQNFMAYKVPYEQRVMELERQYNEMQRVMASLG